MCVQEQGQLRIRGIRGSEIRRNADTTSAVEEGGAGARPQGFQLDGAVTDELWRLRSARFLLDLRILVAVTVLLHRALVKAQKESNSVLVSKNGSSEISQGSSLL